MADWSNLPTELLGLIALHLLSVLDIIRFRAIFSRVTLSSSSSKGWLIKHDAELIDKTFRLLSPLSRFPFRLFRCRKINLLKFNVTEIHPTYIVQKQRKKQADKRFIRAVVEGRNDRLVVICCDRKVRYWNGEMWTRFEDQVGELCDLIVHQGMTYALDSRGIIWWISPARGIFRYGPALNDDIAKSCSWRDRSLVGGSCGDLYIVDRIVEGNRREMNFATFSFFSKVIRDDVGNTPLEREEGGFYPRTLGFKVYKIDDDSCQWEEVKSLGGNAFVMATDTRFSVVASEYYGCLENSIYFTDEHKRAKDYEIKVFKLDDGSITTMSGYYQDCFQMFFPNRRWNVVV
ncbi:unnamed protein product [Microthlaspi erraticum]|uniref:KIB1-4 beta-propeller domain-containing protein n=1 Tax=Microthlaspi erraticum TaxID=1685480 RepID=A0A6D2IBX8_9BRAS|nr:unnamed protein product [Microthlaspi erraticum]